MSKITGNEQAMSMCNELGNIYSHGLTIRQYYAGLALNGILASWRPDSMPEGKGIELAVKTSLEAADQLINELNQTE